MGDSEKSSAALDALRAQFDKAMSERDNVKRFRILLDVTEEARHIQSKVNKSLKEHQKSEAFLEVEKRFVTKHETKLDALAQGFFNCYVTPGKARAALDQLCDNYDTQYVLDVVALGVRRLSKPLGVDLFGIKSEARQLAETYYENNLHPALEKAIPDHGDYLKLKRLNVEERYSKVLEDIENCRKSAAAIEVALKKYRDRFATEAKAMPEEDVEKLSSSEAAERVKVLPPKMQEAIFEAQKEALTPKPRPLL